MLIKFKKLSPDAILPTRAYEDAACWDLYATKDVEVYPGESAVIPVELAMELPSKWVAMIYTKSGHGFKGARAHLGIIDADYRGTLDVFMFNHGPSVLTFFQGKKCAQIFFQPVPEVTIQIVEELEETQRGIKGFGSSG